MFGVYKEAFSGVGPFKAVYKVPDNGM